MSSERTDDGSGALLLVPVLIVIVGLTVANLSGALLKVMASELNVAVLTFGRYVGYLVFLLPLALYRYGKQVVRPPQAGVQIIRAAMILLASLAFIYSVRFLPLANTIAIFYIYPFLIALLSPWLLDERASPAMWAGIVGGFIGILIVMRPDISLVNAGTLSALAAGFVYAVHIILTRKVATSAPALVSNSFMALVALAMIAPFAFFWWEPVSARQALFMLGMGGVNALAHMLILRAYALASAPALAPFTYTEIIAAIMWGFLFFADVPDQVTLVGMTIIIAAGVMVTQSEKLGRLVGSRRMGRGR